MLVENCCEALLANILPILDRQRLGYAIEVGCGTFSFYCNLFDRLGFSALAVEPLPVKSLRHVCKYHRIPLVEACLASHTGTIDLYIGNFEGQENLNLNSTRPGWWGATANAKKVNALTISNLVEKFNIESITCFKIDIEGAEYSVLSQFTEYGSALLPKVIMFEYGGGGKFETRQGGWSDAFLQDTMNTLGLLHDLGYKQAIKVDAEDGFTEEIIDLSQDKSKIVPTKIFSQGNIYGNIIAIRSDLFFSESDIRSVCQTYRDNKAVLNPLHISEPLLRRITRKIRYSIFR